MKAAQRRREKKGEQTDVWSSERVHFFDHSNTTYSFYDHILTEAFIVSFGTFLDV
jgi:hypothetical protein